MATLEGVRLKKQVLNCQFGNVSVAWSSFTAAAAQVADVVRLVELPAGAQVLNIRVKNDALGASSTLAVGYEYVDSAAGAAAPSAFSIATATASAGTFRGDFHPLPTFADPVYITATIGGAAINGKFTLLVDYEFVGTM